MSEDTSVEKENENSYFYLLVRVTNRDIYCRGKKLVLYASVMNPRHIK